MFSKFTVKQKEKQTKDIIFSWKEVPYLDWTIRQAKMKAILLKSGFEKKQINETANIENYYIYFRLLEQGASI